MGGYIASAHGKFWPGAAAGAVFAFLWVMLCRAFATSVEGSFLVAFLALLVYIGGAVYGGIARRQRGLAPIDGNTALSLVTGILCFLFPPVGVVATLFLNRSDSDYSQPALIGTSLGACVWIFLMIGAAVSNAPH